MIKMLVFLVVLILSVLGSKQDSLSDLDKDGVKISDSLKHPCSAQLSPSILSNENLQNKELVSQQTANEENKKEKVSINCLVKIHKETATEIVPKTDTGENGNSRRSPDVQYLIKTKDKFRDFTTNKNRKKVNEEPTFHINLSEKCTKYEPKVMENDLSSGRRFNIPDNIQDTENSSFNVSSQRGFYPISKFELNLISNQSKIPKEADQDLSTQKIISSTSTISGELNQILSKKVTNNLSTPKYVLSTSFHDEKNPNHGQEVSDKTSTKKYDLSLTPTDNMKKDSFVLLDFTNKKISDKPSAIKYDLKSIITNKTSEMPIQFHDYKKVSEESSTNKNYEKSFTPIYNNLLLHHDDSNTVASHSNKETDDKSSFIKYDSNSIPKDDIQKNPFLLHNVGDKELQDKDYSDKFDLESILKNIFHEHYQDYSYRKDGDKLSNTKKGQTNAINHNINKNVSSYPGLISNKHNNNLKLTEISKEHNQELAHDKISDSNASKGSQSNETPKEVLRTTIDITEPHLVEPTTGYSIKDLFKSRVMLLESTRVCYACSSISDHSCWHPGRSTTVKYCRKGHNACLTKTFKTEDAEFIVIRDCGVPCDGTWPVLDAKYKSCSICNEDMCNDHLVGINSGHTNNFNLMYFVLITVIIKFIL